MFSTQRIERNEQLSTFSENGDSQICICAFHCKSCECQNQLGHLTNLHKVGNANAYGHSDWVDDMHLAEAAGIDAFALNIGATDQTTTTQVPQAYAAAAQTGFKVFLSFDYSAQGPWSTQAVINTIRTYANSRGQFKVNGLPLVSTFEGTSKASDWVTIRHSTPLFLVPEWTSIAPSDFKSSDEQYVDGVCKCSDLISFAGLVIVD